MSGPGPQQRSKRAPEASSKPVRKAPVGVPSAKTAARGDDFAEGEARFAAAEQPPWVRDMAEARSSAAARVGPEAERREKVVGAAEGLVGQLEWGADYPGFGGAGCVSLPFIAAAKAGLISMAQARKLSGASGEYVDAEQVLMDNLQVGTWSATPPSRRWGEGARPKVGDIAVFVSKSVGTPFFEHIALCGGGNVIYSLEPATDADPSQLLRKKTIDEYMAASGNPDIGCLITPFPF